MDARLAQLKGRLRDFSMVDMTRIPRDCVGLGSRVVVLDLTKGEELSYRIVISEAESDVTNGKISTRSSPIGRGLLGKRVGDTVKIQDTGWKPRNGDSAAHHDSR